MNWLTWFLFLALPIPIGTMTATWLKSASTPTSTSHTWLMIVAVIWLIYANWLRVFLGTHFANDWHRRWRTLAVYLPNIILLGLIIWKDPQFLAIVRPASTQPPQMAPPTKQSREFPALDDTVDTVEPFFKSLGSEDTKQLLARVLRHVGEYFIQFMKSQPLLLWLVWLGLAFILEKKLWLKSL